MKALLARLRPGDGAIDIGANVGSVTTRLADAVWAPWCGTAHTNLLIGRGA